MKRKTFLPALVVLIVVPLVSFWAASARLTMPDAPSAGSDSEPAELEPVSGKDVQRVVLSERAAERIGIATTPVVATEGSRPSAAAAGLLASAASEDDVQRTIIPYSAVLYDANGNTWVYTNPEPLAFVRHHIAIDFIDGDEAVLLDGPPPGTPVVTVGAAQLFGTELFGLEFETGQ